MMCNVRVRVRVRVLDRYMGNLEAIGKELREKFLRCDGRRCDRGARMRTGDLSG
jgi:hypothetical protein